MYIHYPHILPEDMIIRPIKSTARPLVAFPGHRAPDARGFALVVTVSLLVLLSVIALGFLSLSAVSLRGSSLENAQMQARANARLALQMAIGELQRHAGPDTRVTASADILDDPDLSPSNLAVTGVWKSWEGTDHTAPGDPAAARPIPPEYDSKRRSAYASSGRFLDWLVSKPFDVIGADLISDDPAWSLSEALEKFVSNAPIVDDATGKEVSVPLVSGPTVAQPLRGSLAAGDLREIHVVPVTINNGSGQRGSFAWWVGGENQKARLPVPHKPADDDKAGWSMLAKSHAIPDPTALALDALLAPDGATKATKAMSLNTVSLIAPQIPNAPDPAKQFHDLSTSSVGLLTNTATGGWRKDLSLFTENWDKLPASGVEVFRITPDDSSSALATMTRPTNSTLATVRSQGSIFYPWSTYRDPGQPKNYGGRSKNYTGAVSSWHNLMTYATLYKQLTLQGGTPTIAARGAYAMNALNDTLAVPEPINHFNYLHQVRVLPLLGRFQAVYSYRSVPVTPNDPATKYRVQIGITPVGTIWNPYNVALEPIHITHGFHRPLPPAFRFKIGTNYSAENRYVRGNQNDLFDEKNSIRTDGVWRRIPFDSIGAAIEFKAQVAAQNPRSLAPGETMVFNKQGSAGYNPATPTASAYTYYANLAINIGTTAAPIQVSEFDATDEISLDARFDTYSGSGNPGCFYEMRDFRNTTALNYFSRHNIMYDPLTANRNWPPMGSLDDPAVPLSFPSVELSAATGAGLPFLSLLYGPRLASTSGSASTHGFTSKGFQQTSPFMFNVNAGPRMQDGVMSGNEFATYTGNRYTGGIRGANHPVNTAMDYEFLTHSSWIDSSLPNCSQDGKNNGYLVSGTQAGDGLKRIAVAELPLRPLGSLAELQHWDLRMDNPAPPHQFNIIANSDAQPLFPPNAIFTGWPITRTPTNIILQHDDSYCANHILFDDWFFSTIAPQPTTFGPDGKTLQETFTTFVRDGARLDNRAYRPIFEDRAVSAAQATQLFNEEVNTGNSYRTIASRLEVDGMFNVNSTSVKAWRAILGHARNQRMPYYDNNGDMDLSDPTDFAVSRTTVASDVAAGENGSSGAFAGASEYSGYRVFTEEMLDELAEEMVKQVRKRGPFLSLSEFVNRQLANNTSDNLALAGAVQSALNVLAAKDNDDPNAIDYKGKNPYTVLQDESSNAGLSVLNAAGKGAGSEFHFFSKASEGKSVYGLPGWPRQADILRPLAPILSARDDTFTIRAYGDARDASGTIIARATCEAVVRRQREFVSPAEDAADITGPPTAKANKDFGRRFEIISFRWLHADEV